MAAEEKPIRLSLNTIHNSRLSLSRVIRLYAKGQLKENTMRALTYGLSHLLKYWELEKNLQIEEQIEKINETLQEKGIL